MLDEILQSLGVYRLYESRLNSQIEGGPIPGHIGIILDGNRRWAQNHSSAMDLGHTQGADVVERLLDWCHEIGIKSITLYVLSTENLQRSSEEVVRALPPHRGEAEEAVDRREDIQVQGEGKGDREVRPPPSLDEGDPRRGGEEDGGLRRPLPQHRRSLRREGGDHRLGQGHRRGREEGHPVPRGHNRGDHLAQALHVAPPQPRA